MQIATRSDAGATNEFWDRVMIEVQSLMLRLSPERKEALAGGAARVLDLLSAELRTTMGMLGAQTLADIRWVEPSR